MDFLNASFPPGHIGTYIGIPPPQINIAQAGQHPYYIQTQPQNNWAPAMPLSGYQPPMPQYILPTIQPYHIQQNPQFNQPISNESNNWNPALSTNVTNLISSSTNSSSFYTTANTNNRSNENQK
jgi:hypothetical protein